VAAVPSGLSPTPLKIIKRFEEPALSIFRTEKYLWSESIGRRFLQTLGTSLSITRFTEQAGVAVTLQIRICKELGSNLGRYSGYPELFRAFSQSLKVLFTNLSTLCNPRHW
jgi:hypothetical protein